MLKRLSLARKIFIASTLSLACFMLLFQSAFAWTWRENNFDSNPNDYQCGLTSSTPCLYWPEPNGQSSTIWAFLSLSLTNNIWGYDYASAVNRAASDYNAAPALNPYLYTCSNDSCNAQVTYSVSTGNLGNGIYAETPYGSMGSVQHSSQYYAVMTANAVVFNEAIHPNSALLFSLNQADERFVATHETGHVEGLGHTGHYPAIMRQTGKDPNGNNVTYYWLQADDITGLETQYNGSIPAE